MVSGNQVGFRHLRAAFQGQKFQRNQINSLRNARDSDLKTIWKGFQRFWRWIFGEKQLREYRRKFRSILEIRGQCGSVATKYPSDRQFYLWHLVYLDRLFLLSNLTWRRAHVTAGDWQGSKWMCKCCAAFRWGTLVPEGFLDFSPHERAAKCFAVLSQLPHEMKNQENP